MTDISTSSTPLPQGRVRALARGMMLCSLMVLLCVVVAGSFGLRTAYQEALSAKQELLSANANARQSMQQLYELANIYLDDLPDPTALTEQEKKLLSAWVACDESFLRLNQNSQTMLLERSLVARRAGTIRGLFGEYDRATRHLNESLSLLEQSGQEDPDQLSYQLLEIECYGLLAWTNANGKNPREAVRACRNAAAVLDRLALPETPDSDRSLVKSIHQVTHAAFGLGEIDLADRFGQAELDARSRLSARTPGDPVSQQQLQQARDFLEMVRSRAGANNAL